MAKLFSQRKVKPYMEQVEELAKLRRPSQTMFAEDTGSSMPFYLPGMRQRSGVNVATEARPLEAPQLENVDLDVQLEDYPEYTPPQEGQNMAGSFVEWLTSQYVPQGMASAPGGGVTLDDGTTIYPDGGIKTVTGEIVRPIGSAPGGKLLYTDGQVRAGGLNELIKIIFGQDRPITQEFGNINPGMGYANNMHRGVDVRTRDLTGFQRNLKLPFNTTVAQVLTADDGNPYGNSILLQLPTGEMLRFSHLAGSPQYRQGDTVPAWSTFGTPGSTGNSTGEHLDLEYYNAAGQIDNPSNFRPPEELAVPLSQLAQPESQEIRSESPQQGQILGATNQAPQVPQAPQIQPPQPKPDRPMNFDFTKVQPNPESRPPITAANMIDVANPTGAFGAGISETLRGDRAGAKEELRETISGIGTALNAPNLDTYNLSKEQGTSPFRQLLGNVADKLSQQIKGMGINLPEMNISETIAGGKTTFTDAMKPKQAYAADINIQSEIPQSGQGLQSLAGVTGPENAMSRPDISDFGQRKAIGQEGMQGNVLGISDTAEMQSARPAGDIRDPFFKMGLDKKYGSFIDPEKARSGALTMDLFKPDFFRSMGNVEGAFKGTSLFSPAQQKYQSELDNFKNQFKSMYGSGYDQGDVNRILASIPANADLTSLNLPAPSRVQSTSRTSGSSSSGYTPQQTAQIGQTTGQGVSKVSYPTRTVSAPKGTTLRADSSGSVQAVPTGGTPVKSPSAQLAVKPSGNLFSNLFSSIMNLFKR